MPPGGLVGRALERLEEATGWTAERTDRLTYLEEADQDRRSLQKELDLLAYTALDYFSGKPQDLKAEERRSLAQKARVAWMKDPQAGAAVDLQNDFVFGRGVPKPKLKDPEAQKVVDEAWDDPVNQRILTSHQAQMALGTDLALQSNLFALFFDDGDDGRVRVSLLDHDTVEAVVEHPEDRHEVLYYVARRVERRWDFTKDAPADPKPAEAAGRDGKPKVLYYEHWRNVERAREEGTLPDGYSPAAEKRGEGRVFHVADNRTTEMHFGYPRMDRTLRWFSAYNRFMEARVDMMAAAAAFVMKRKVKGTPSQVAKMATKALSRRGELGASYDDEDRPAGPRAGILTENESVTHEDFKIGTGSGDAAQDARMLGAQVSAATRWPRSYYGDAEASSLATATSLELPVLKRVEAVQELCEGLYRHFIDRVLERAVDAGRLSAELTDEELEAARASRIGEALRGDPAARPRRGEPVEVYVERVQRLIEAHEDKDADEAATQRDLSYEFKMPNPLRRAMGDLVSAIQSIAQTFDPNGTNVELSRVLLAVALEEALEVGDAADLVERVFPPGYTDPAMAPPGGAPGAGAPDDFGPFGPDATEPPPGAAAPPPASSPPTRPVGPDGKRHSEANPYGAPMRSSAPEEMREARYADLPEEVRAGAEARLESFDAAFASRIGPLLDAVVGPVSASNGRVNGQGGSHA